MSSTTIAETPGVKPTQRIASIDAYRGFVMLLMMAEVLHSGSVADAIPDSGFWAFIDHHQSHSAWLGCTLHDLIQPSFSFIVGLALPFSLLARSGQQQSQLAMTLHAFRRALTLVLLGVFLRSTHASQTNWTFEDTLSQIGLGYGFLYILGWRSVRAQWIAFAVILVGYWLAFALYPLPGPDFDYTQWNVKPEWAAENWMTGFRVHWNMNSNFAWAFDTWFMNLFSREKPFVGNGGGYSTLSFIPTLATMILGLIAGGVLKSDRPAKEKARWFVVAGLIALVSGWLIGAVGICPVVKKIWTPSWVLFSGGWCLLFTAAFFSVIDWAGYRKWQFPLAVIGMNSIAAYLIAHLFDGFIYKNLVTHLGLKFFAFAGQVYEPFFHGLAVLSIYWLILYWMYRRRLFLRI